MFNDAPLLSDSDIHAVVAQINSQGFGIIRNYIDAKKLADMRRFVDRAMKKSGGEYIAFTGAEAVGGSALDALAENSSFKALMRNIYAIGTGQTPPPVEFHLVLRCLSGKSAARHSLNFHYDSYVVSALIPIEIPDGKNAGDLIMLPNIRKIRRSYLANMLDKVLLDNRLTQILLTYLFKNKILNFTHIQPVPGNIYFFWGYRSIHTNEACDEDKVRATALYHYANPHAGSALSQRLKFSRSLFSRHAA
jgi:hypothetical protein